MLGIREMENAHEASELKRLERGLSSMSFTSDEFDGTCSISHGEEEEAIADDESDSVSVTENKMKRKHLKKKVQSSPSGRSSLGASVMSGYPSPLSGIKTTSDSPPSSRPIDIFYDGEHHKSPTTTPSPRRSRHSLFKEDLRERAWQKKRDLHSEESNSYQSDFHSSAGEEPRTPTSVNDITNVDMDELKGCLDLGFGFSYDELPELSHTLPALEVCYAIGHGLQVGDEHHPPLHNSSSLSTLDVDSSTSDGYAHSPSTNWIISSPGDHPQDVKARLKVWAQAVACSVRLCSP